MAATQLTRPAGHPVDNEASYHPDISPRSSSASSEIQTIRMAARPQSYTPSHLPSTFPSPMNQETDDDEFSRPDFPSSQQPMQKDGRMSIPSALKGKQRASAPAGSIDMGTRNEGKREYRSTWIIDEESSIVGADAWMERDRVILVLGREFNIIASVICSRYRPNARLSESTAVQPPIRFHTNPHRLIIPFPRLHPARRTDHSRKDHLPHRPIG
jgi:hypothetical protein